MASTPISPRMSEPSGPVWAPWQRLGAAPRAVTTTRLGGVSTGPRATLNLGERSGDAAPMVAVNRQRARRGLGVPGEPFWLHQVHGTTPVQVTPERVARGERLQADAAWTTASGLVCAALTADCLPVVIGEPEGTCVAVAHAGWRGLAAGVIGTTLAAMPVPPARLWAWLGPAIGPRAFIVGEDVRDAFAGGPLPSDTAFRRRAAGGWFADLYEIARLRLRASGVQRIHGGGHCTWHEPERWFSHRRDGADTGRMATLAWLP